MFIKYSACGAPNMTERNDLIVRGNMYKVHSKLRVECAEASNIFETITCLENGSWSAITIKCGTSFLNWYSNNIVEIKWITLISKFNVLIVLCNYNKNIPIDYTCLFKLLLSDTFILHLYTVYKCQKNKYILELLFTVDDCGSPPVIVNAAFAVNFLKYIYLYVCVYFNISRIRNLKP